MSQELLFQHCQFLADHATPFVLVTLVEASGSTPQDQGAKIIVTEKGRVFGTVGGGRVEAKAIDVAKEMLRNCVSHRLLEWNLKADVGMTCGGRVKLFLETYGVATWRIVIFGAGHIAQALTRLLATIPCQVTCVDSRNEWLAQLPGRVRVVQTDDLAAEVERLTTDSFVLCMTQGHGSDLPILKRIYQADLTFPFVGVIGSRAKAAALRKELDAAGIATERIRFHCPVGLPFGTNHPGEIAISIAAQLLQVRDDVT